MTSLDPKEKNSRSQFSANKDKELSDLNKEKSSLTDQKCPADFSEDMDLSRGSELTPLDPKGQNSRSQFSANRDKELSDLNREKSILTNQKCPSDCSEDRD